VGQRDYHRGHSEDFHGAVQVIAGNASVRLADVDDALHVAVASLYGLLVVQQKILHDILVFGKQRNVAAQQQAAQGGVGGHQRALELIEFVLDGHEIDEVLVGNFVAAQPRTDKLDLLAGARNEAV